VELVAPYLPRRFSIGAHVRRLAHGAVRRAAKGVHVERHLVLPTPLCARSALLRTTSS
jgi:hypothetical protein